MTARAVFASHTLPHHIPTITATAYRMADRVRSAHGRRVSATRPQGHSRHLPHCVISAKRAAKQPRPTALLVVLMADADVPGMYDTVAAFCPAPRVLDDGLFQGGTVQESFDKAQVVARLWLNPRKDDTRYKPRVTYWRGHGVRRQADQPALGSYEPATAAIANPDQYPHGLLKLEFSIPQMAGVIMSNPSHADALRALDEADKFVSAAFGDGFPRLLDWTVQRMDYTWMFHVAADLRAYMAVLSSLRISGMSRHPFDATAGVVWKAQNRWVKFYDKAREMGFTGTDQGILRYEVSNYKSAMQYMAESWFGCDRRVAEFMQPGRALFVLASQFDKLGLYNQNYGHEEVLLQRLRDTFGESVAGAYYVLTLMRRYGKSAYDDNLALTSRNNFNTWRRKLRKEGFITYSKSDEFTEMRQTLSPLHLPTSEVFDYQIGNLGDYQPSDTSWQEICRILGVAKARTSNYLTMRYEDYAANYERRMAEA